MKCLIMSIVPRPRVPFSFPPVFHRKAGVLQRCAAILGRSHQALEEAFNTVNPRPPSFYAWVCIETIGKFSDDEFLFVLERPSFAHQMLANFPVQDDSPPPPAGCFGLNAFTVIGAYMHPVADFLTTRSVFDALCGDSSGQDYVKLDTFKSYVDSLNSVLGKISGQLGERQRSDLNIPAGEDILLRDGKKKSPIVWLLSFFLSFSY